MPAMTQQELLDFLDTDVLCRLSCLDAEGDPYVVPCWFQFADEGFYIIPRARSAWAQYLVQDPRVALCIDRDSGERVLIKGRARLLEEPNIGGRWVAIAAEMAKRYAGDAGLAYLQQTLDEPRWLFFVEPLQRVSWQGGSWAQRYKSTAW